MGHIHIMQIIVRAEFSDPFGKVISCDKPINYKLIVMRKSVCLFINPIMVNCASVFLCRPADQVSDSMMLRHEAFQFRWRYPEFFVIRLVHRSFIDGFRLVQNRPGSICRQ